MLNNLNVGSVIKWSNFPYPHHGNERKSRWFIYIGKTGIFTNPICMYLCTTTTSLDDFKKGGKRESHLRVFFKSKSSPFDENCLLDIDEKPYPFEEVRIFHNSDIEYKGDLEENKLREIYNKICKSNSYSFIVKKDIHKSLNSIGITGLKRPKR
ncbi:MAG: hypothetical protein ACP5FK_00600 [bacterium]